MKRGVGIKYQTEWLEPDALKEWLFDHIGEPQTRSEDGSLIAGSEEGVYFTFSTVSKLLRIALWTDLEPKDAWEKINEWARKVGEALKCNLTSYMIDLYEYDDDTKGYKCRYNDLIPGEVERHVAAPQPTTAKTGNC
jgi:hypothetical protein